MKLRAVIQLVRPAQWVKNGFVLVGLLFGHGWNDPVAVGAALSLLAAFCLLSSAVYALNDVMDRDADRVHPEKRRRPVADGRISPQSAVMLSVVLAAAALGIAAAVSTAALVIAAAYLALNIAYSLGLKHVALLDVFIIASGFMLRILAGTSGIGIEPSRWLLLCGLMVTLFLGFAKRRAELAALDGAAQAGEAPAQQRRSLATYTLELLDRMIAVTAAGALIAYALYTVDARTVQVHGTDKLVFTVPFVVYGLYRHLWLLYRHGGGADPTSQLLRDPHLLAAVLGWLGTTWWLIALPAAP
jgi:4-hydroxybenzoate polyprenyltransferase